MRHRRLVVLGTLFGVGIGLAWAAFPVDPPNDPEWPSQYFARGSNVGIGLPNPLAEYPLATDAEGASGLSARDQLDKFVAVKAPAPLACP